MDKDFEKRSNRSLFNDKTIALSEGGWKCLQIESPAGTWFLVSEKSLAERFWARKNGEGRAVFSRAEMHEANKVLEKMEHGSRQKWLGSMIDVKSVFEGAVIENVVSNST